MNTINVPLVVGVEEAFYADRSKYLPKYYVYVEGASDKLFYSKLFNSTVECKSLSDVEKSEFFFWDPKSRKNTIVTNMKLKHSPPNFGIVDRDHEFIAASRGVIYTDTSDLETMMVSTDKNVCLRLEKTLTVDDVKKALFMAYQWGYIISELEIYKSKEFDRKKLIKNSELCYNEHFQISIMQAREHLKQLDYRVPSHKDLKILVAKNPNFSGFCCQEHYTDVDVEKMSRMWQYINGHDFVYFLQYINCALRNRFMQKNNAIEFAMIENYDINCIKSTNLYNLLSEFGLA